LRGNTVEQPEIAPPTGSSEFRATRANPTIGRQSWAKTQSLVAAARVAFDMVAFLLSLSFAWLIAGTLAPTTGPERQLVAGQLPNAVTFAELALLACGLLTYFTSRGHYQQRAPFWSDLRHVLLGSVMTLLLNSFLEFAFKTSGSRLLIIGTWVMFAIVAMLMRCLMPRILDRAGIWRIPTIVVGEGEAARRAILALTSKPALGYDIIGQISLPSLSAQPTAHLWHGIMRQFQAHFVILAPDADECSQRAATKALVHEAVPFAIISSLEGLPGARCARTYFFNHNMVMLSYWNNLLQPVARAAKVVFDLTVAASLVLFLSPLLLAVAVAVKLGGGPALYLHHRVGAGGRPFRCLKFRTMVVNADAMLHELLHIDPAAAVEWATKQKLRNDPRITPIGALLRKTSLDELPQLLNVLRLEMSLVGPRPIVEEEMAHYDYDITYYLEMRPGLTGLWQVSGRSDTTYAQRKQLDTWYVKNWTLWRDIVILAKTIPAVLKRKGAV
jgi:Undecaprenyl-phosphate galactose phosphotransferase WbaP